MNNENNNIGNQIPNNNQNVNPVNSATSQFQPGTNDSIQQKQAYGQVNSQLNMYQQAQSQMVNQNYQQASYQNNTTNQNVNNTYSSLNNNSNQMKKDNKLIEQANICQNCNAAFPLEYNSCPECGSTNLEKLYTSTLLQEMKNNENNQQSNYQSISSNDAMQSLNNKQKDDNKIFIIVGIVIIVIILAITLPIFLGNKSDNKSKSEYENDNTNTNSNSTTNHNTYEYSGFEFEKVPGYSYELGDGLLSIYNSYYYTTVSINKYNFEQIRTKAVEISNELSSRGFTTSNARLQTISGKELVTCEIFKNGISGIYFIISAPTNNSYTFAGVVMNKSYTVNNNNDLTEVVKLVSNSKYVGNYSNYSKSFNFDYDLDNMIK